MAFLKFGQEGEIVANQVVLDTTYADVDHRGGRNFAVNEYSQLSVTPMADMWLHGKVMIPVVNSAVNSDVGGNFFGIKDTNNTELLVAYSARINNPDRHKLIFGGISNDAGTWADMFTYGDIPAGTEMAIDLHANLTGTTMVLEAYVNGSLITNRNITVGTPTWGLPSIGMYGMYGEGAPSTIWHEVGISDTPTVGIGLSTLEATGAGFHTTGVGAYTDITGNGVDLSTSVSLLNIGDKESWIISPLAGKTISSSSVKNITFSSLVVHNGGAVTGYRYFVRSGGIDYPTAGGTITPTALIGNYVEEVSINPATGAAFTAAEVSAGIEVGIEAV